MKKLPALAILCALSQNADAQKFYLDSLKMRLSQQKTDSIRFNLLDKIYFGYVWTNADSALYYANEQLSLSNRMKDPRAEAISLKNISNTLSLSGNHQPALKIGQKALRIAEQLNDKKLMSQCYNAIASTYNELRDYNESIKYNYICRDICRELNDRRGVVSELSNLAINYNLLDQLDSTLFYAQEAYKLAIEYGKWDVDMIGSILIRLGAVHRKMGNYEIGLAYLRKAIESNIYYEDWIDYHEATMEIGNIYKIMNKKDSCAKYFQLSMEGAEKIDYKRGLLEASTVLKEFYKGINKDSTLKYMEMESVLKDSLFNETKIRTVQNMKYNENEYQKELESERITAAKERKDNLQVLGITVFIITLFVLLILLSRIKTNPRIINYLGLISLLLLFEFIGLLLHPLIAKITHHNPVLMLSIMVCIAGLLVPVHHRLENWVRHKLA